MRILFLSNYFPPRVYGGYELWCHEVALELVARGHEVCALTSQGLGPDRVLPPADGVRVCRMLHLEVEAGLLRTAVRLIATRRRLEQENLNRVRHVVGTFCPHAGLIWGMWNVPRSVPALAEELLRGRVAYYLCDYWPSLPSAYLQQWQGPARRRVAELLRQLVSRPVLALAAKRPPVSLRLEHPICVSQAVRKLLVQEGVAVSHAQIIHGGTRPQEFVSHNGRDARWWGVRNLRVLYAGRLTADKGVHTAIHAVARLAQRSDGRPVTLDLVGSGDAKYERELRQLVTTYGLNARVRFRGTVPRSKMPEVLSQYDVLVHGSEWEEPFSRVVLEAMAAGLVVIGTTTGGTGEVLVEAETGLTFAPGDPGALATQLGRLVDDPMLSQRLTTTARRRIEESFTFARMVDQIEATLLSLANGAERPNEAR